MAPEANDSSLSPHVQAVLEHHLDNLTHSLVGAAISKAGAERMTPLATTTLVVSANAPDVDVLSYARGEYFALAFRRGLTHGWPAVLLLPFLVTAVLLAWDRWVRRRNDPNARPARVLPMLALSAAGLSTHPTLDWMNTYGMRWSLPFDDTWSYGDALFIIDPWIWLTLGGAVFLASDPGRWGLSGWSLLASLATMLLWVGMGGVPFLMWLLGLAAIGVLRATLGPGRAGQRTPLVAAASTAVALYVVLMIGAGALAMTDVVEAAHAEELGIAEIMVAPILGNPFAREIEVRTLDAYVPGTHRWSASPRAQLHPESAVRMFSSPNAMPPTLADAIVTSAHERTKVRNYLVWARHPYIRITPEPAGWTVRFSDARYDGRPEAGGLAGVSVQLSDPVIR